MHTNPRCRKESSISNSLTQHGGSSGISKIGRRRDPITELLLDKVREVLGKDISKEKGIFKSRRDPSYRIYNRTGSVFIEVCAKEVYKFYYFCSLIKRGKMRMNIKCFKEEIEER